MKHASSPWGTLVCLVSFMLTSPINTSMAGPTHPLRHKSQKMGLMRAERWNHPGTVPTMVHPDPLANA
jgi:hypothetical protein